eukprot:2935328-Amphidinium_carterae.1
MFYSPRGVEVGKLGKEPQVRGAFPANGASETSSAALDRGEGGEASERCFNPSSLQDKVAAEDFCWLTSVCTVDLDPHGVGIVIGETMKSKTSFQPYLYAQTPPTAAGLGHR